METHNQPHDTFSGFDEARHTLWCFEARAHVKNTLEGSILLSNRCTAIIHVDNSSRRDRMFLTAFDVLGRTIGADTLFNDDGRGLESTDAFSIARRNLRACEGSDLAAVSLDGWLIDVEKLESYDLAADRRQIQKDMVLAHLRDMVVSGDANALISGTVHKTA